MRLEMSRLAARLAGLVLLLVAALGLVAPASAQATASSPHAEGTILLERSAATPGDTFLGALRLKLAEGWHVYWINPGDSGLPPTAAWASSPEVSAGAFKFPTPHAIPLAVRQLAFYPVPVVPLLIQQGACRGPEAMPAHFVVGITHAPQRRQNGILTHWP